MTEGPVPNPIDRQAVVSRHRVRIAAFDPRHTVSVGNGEFAFGADVTGLQTFPELYAADIPLCTQAQWGWHSFPTPAALAGRSLRLREYDTHGRSVGYATDAAGQQELFDHLRQSPHRLHLGRIGLRLVHRDGSPAKVSDLREIDQSLDLWTGLLTSRFRFDGQIVEVRTSNCGDLDGIAVRVTSPLIAAGQLAILVAFPYGSPAITAADWDRQDAHRTEFRQGPDGTAQFIRTLDADRYYVAMRWAPDGATLEPAGPHDFTLAATGDRIEAVLCFAPGPIEQALPTLDDAQAQSRRFWQDYWSSGAAIDLAGSTDPRASELERRIVLSQYLLRVNCAGSLPPAETGLTCNSWYGKFHLEMHWWHGVHFALWGRLPLLERSLGYYHRILPEARAIAERQGYHGARWPKMVGPDGVDSPSPVGPLLLWQQPHPIYYAELRYRERPQRQTLDAWATIVEETADFMASFAHFDERTGRYVLGPPIKTVSENTDPLSTTNPLFELTYWRFGLRVAQQWRERRGLTRRADWDNVLERLATPAQAHGCHLMQEGMADTYSKWNWEHPALVGGCGVLPGDGIDPIVHRRTVEKVMQVWQWDRCWGWDFPMAAMAAARAGRPDLAIDALFIESKKNTYSLTGHNYQRPGLSLYLPGNGGLLAAVAMMAAGWDGGPGGHAPGFPADAWTVRHEGFRQMP